MSTKTQNEMILDHLKQGGTITSLEALRKFGVLRLSGRVLDLRWAGHNITSTMVKVQGRDGWKRVAQYRLVRKGAK